MRFSTYEEHKSTPPAPVEWCMTGAAVRAERAPVAIAPAQFDHADPPLFAEIMAAVRGVAERAAFTGGDEVSAFEREFADYCEAAHAVGVSSGTDAIALALRALHVRPGDEVILPANSFIATAEAVSMVGATPRLVDVDPRTQLLTAGIVERHLTRRTRCIIPVHLYGRTVELEPILRLASEAGTAVLEDACQAHGARYRGRRVGGIGHCGCFSFYPAKNLGAWGDGGAVVTNDAALAHRIRLLRSHGEERRYHHQVSGQTARLHALQAAVLRVKLRRLDGWNEQRRTLARILERGLGGVAGLVTPAPVGAGEDHVYHQYVVRTADRDGLRAHLTEHGVPTGVHYPVPIHRTMAYAHLGLRAGSLPVSERLARSICSLTIVPTMEPAAVNHIVGSVLEFYAGARTAEAA
jgi:dTDP-3-amino-3,4,6-trideoxy-alpha-D-glucose transaminase